MYLKPDELAVGKENFYAAIGSKSVVRTRSSDKTPSREFLLTQIENKLARDREKKAKPAAPAKNLGQHYYGYGRVEKPVRIGVIGTGDEGSVLIGALNPAYVEVGAIADIRPYNRFRAFEGEVGVPVRPGLKKVYGWTDKQAQDNVKVYHRWEELIDNAEKDGLEGVIIALPLFLHAPVAIAAMKKGLHVLTEKLMAQTVTQCKEMARAVKEYGPKAKEKMLYLAVGHQRHYNILYDNAVELIRNGVLGDVHYIEAQWHRNNLPKKDSWKQPLPPGAKTLDEDPEADVLVKELARWEAEEKKAGEALRTAKDDEKKADAQKAQANAKARVAQVKAQIEDKVVDAKKFGYLDAEWPNGNGRYRRPAIEELIRWRLWDRTGAGMMAELGSHQLDAASIFITAAHAAASADGKVEKVHPLNVSGVANRPVFEADRDIEDHVFCIFEFPAPGYSAKEPQKKIGVQYASVNGTEFGGYGETVYGTVGTMKLEKEKEAMLWRLAAVSDPAKVAAKKGKVTLDKAEKPDDESLVVGQMAMLEAERGYREEIEHWAWCVRNPAPENQPRCTAKVAMGDAVIALVANTACRGGKRIEFKESWFEPESDDTPEDVKPNLGRYA